MGAKRPGGKRPGGKRLRGETTRGGNGLGAKRPGFVENRLCRDSNLSRCKITPPNVIFGFDTFYGVIFMCTFCSKF